MKILIAAVLIAAGALCAYAAPASPTGKSRELAVSFPNGDVTLSGTLLLPAGPGPFPGVVLIHGSGPQDRTWLEPTARRFADHGVAALVYDKRGTGSSAGSWLSSSLTDLAADGAAAVKLLAGRAEIDRGAVGVWAISQGGWVAPLVAADPAVRFLIVVTGGGATPREVEWYGYEQALAKRNVQGEELRSARALVSAYFDYLATGEGLANIRKSVDGAKGSAWYPAVPVGRVLPGEATRPMWSWVATFDPAPSIEKLRIPVLLFFGGNDPFVPPSAIDDWTIALARSSASPTIRVYPEAGHGMTLGEHERAHDDARPPVYALGYFETMFAWLDATRAQMQ